MSDQRRSQCGTSVPRRWRLEQGETDRWARSGTSSLLFVSSQPTPTRTVNPFLGSSIPSTATTPTGQASCRICHRSDRLTLRRCRSMAKCTTKAAIRHAELRRSPTAGLCGAGRVFSDVDSTLRVFQIDHVELFVPVAVSGTPRARLFAILVLFASYNIGGHDDAASVRSDDHAETALR